MSRFPRRGLPGSRAPWWRRLRLIDVVLASALPVTAGAYLLLQSVASYATALHFDDFWSRSRSLSGEFRARASVMRNTLSLVRIDRDLEADEDDPAVLTLVLPAADWRALAGNPQEGFDAWTDATVVHQGRLDRVRLRKRGDNSIHWLSPKVSFTLRTPRESLQRGYRTLGFSVKDVVPQYLAAQVAQTFGLPGSRQEIVPVFVNQRFAGLYRMIEIADESMLRLQGRMPGNIYRGDAAERSEYYKGLPRSLFRNPYIWDRVALNDRPSGPPPTRILDLLERLRGTTADQHRDLMAVVDTAHLGALLAALLVVGDPYHMDDVHNQFWYQDPTDNLLSPLPWDLRLLDLERPSIGVNEFWQQALRDPFLVDAAMRRTHDAMQAGLASHADSILDGVTARFHPYLRFETLRAGVIPPVGSVDSSRTLLHHNLAVLDRWIGDVHMVVAGGSAGSLALLDVESRGMTGADLVSLRLAAGAPPGDVVLDTDRNGVLDRSDRRVAGRWERDGAGWSFLARTPVALLPGWSTPERGIAAGRVHYRIFVEGAGARHLIPVLQNRITGTPVEPREWAMGSLIEPGTSFSPWEFPVPTSTPRRWSGDIRLTETLRLPPGDTLRIEPGTTIRLGPEVSLVSRAPILANGTADRPIRVLRLDPARPWGTIALQGRGASGSRFRFLQVEGGGGALVDGVEYIGAINVHAARNVGFEDSRFADNVRSDDLLHVLMGEARVVRSDLVNANSDAIDYDMSTGAIVDSRFLGSGGDAIDLMGSSPLIAGNTFRGSGDKGISVGEASAPVVVANTIESGFRGIEVKDRSTPLLLWNRLLDNGSGLVLQRKNWRYGSGGWPRVLGVEITGLLPFSLDSVSGVILPGPLDTLAVESVLALGGLHRSEVDRALGLIVGAELVSREGNPDWRPVPPVPAVEEETFSASFAPLERWRLVQGERLARRTDLLDLVSQRAGAMERDVDWTLTEEHLLILDLGGRDLQRVVVTLSGDGEPVVFSHRPGRAQYEQVVVPVPPGPWRTLRLDAIPDDRIERVQTSTGLTDLKRGHLLLHRLLLVKRPPPLRPESP